MSCECDLCKRDHEAVRQLGMLTPEQREYWESMYLDLEHAEMDRDVNAAIIDGSWPDAAKLIRYARRKRKAKAGDPPA